MFRIYSNAINFNVVLNLKKHLSTAELGLQGGKSTPLDQLDGGFVITVSKSLKLCKGMQIETKIGDKSDV